METERRTAMEGQQEYKKKSLVEQSGSPISAGNHREHRAKGNGVIRTITRSQSKIQEKRLAINGGQDVQLGRGCPCCGFLVDAVMSDLYRVT